MEQGHMVRLSLESDFRIQSAHPDFTDTASGAPECYRGDNLMGRSTLRVKKSVDIWSLGCVYSEAATWLVLGKEGLRKYRDDRAQETSKIPSFKDGNCFHNGDVVLECVQATHATVRESKRGTDHVTHRILQNMVEEMLAREHARPNAMQLRHKSQLAINRGRQSRQSSRWSFSTAKSPAGSQSPSVSNVLHSPLAKSSKTATENPNRYSIPLQPSAQGTRKKPVNFIEEPHRLEHSPDRIHEPNPDRRGVPNVYAHNSAKDSAHHHETPGRPKQQPPKSQSNYLSVDEATLWKDRQRARRLLKSKTAPNGGDRLMTQIQQRDHVSSQYVVCEMLIRCSTNRFAGLSGRRF